MKHLAKFLLALLFLNNLNAQNAIPKPFSLECYVRYDVSGYLYLDYENKTDSCLIVKNRCSFSGTIKNDITSATFHFKDKKSNSPDVYLESNKMIIAMSVEEKKLDDKSKLYFMTILDSKGSETTKQAIEYSTFLKKHYTDKNFNKQRYAKINDIVTQNPKNAFGCSILCGLSRAKSIDKVQLRKIYAKLDKESQNPMLLRIIDKNLL